VTTIDLSHEDLATVTSILRRHIPELEVRAFGSRVFGKARKTSDLDLALMTDRPLELARMADLREAFTESDLPFKVDLVDWAAASDSFRRIIEKNFVVIRPEQSHA
jgi:predicted nucleotidyltransferase